MLVTRRDIILKWIAYLAALAAVTVFNFEVLGRFPITQPLLLPILAVTVGILEGPRFGAAFGMVIGLTMSSIGHCSLVCIPILALIAWLCGLLAEHVLRRDLVGQLLSCVTVMVLWEAVQVLLHTAARTAAPELLLRIAAGEWFWTLVFSFPVYWVCHFCCLHYGRIYHE